MPTDASWRLKITEAVFESHGWDPTAPVRDLPPEALEYLLYAPKDEQVVIRYRHERGENTYVATFEGVVTNLERRYRETDSEYIKTELEKFMVERPCPDLRRASGSGRRRSRSPSTGGTSRTSRTCRSPTRWPGRTTLAGAADRARADDRLPGPQGDPRPARASSSTSGLDYLTIDRTSQTLSGGEAQRIRLATQIGTTLMGVLYILDEPSIGLHQRDNAKLIATLTRLRDLGNTVLVVEHDEETIRTADWVIDIGPGAGEHGGEIIANGPLEAVLAEPRSITGAYLRGERTVPIPADAGARATATALDGPRRARRTTCEDIDVALPLGTFIAVTGVSGIGQVARS